MKEITLASGLIEPTAGLLMRTLNRLYGLDISMASDEQRILWEVLLTLPRGWESGNWDFDPRDETLTQFSSTDQMIEIKFLCWHRYELCIRPSGGIRTVMEINSPNSLITAVSAVLVAWGA